MLSERNHTVRFQLYDTDAMQSENNNDRIQISVCEGPAYGCGRNWLQSVIGEYRTTLYFYCGGGYTPVYDVKTCRTTVKRVDLTVHQLYLNKISWKKINVVCHTE